MSKFTVKLLVINLFPYKPNEFDVKIDSTRREIESIESQAFCGLLSTMKQLTNKRKIISFNNVALTQAHQILFQDGLTQATVECIQHACFQLRVKSTAIENRLYFT